MSIASGMNDGRADNHEFPDRLLLDPESAEIQVSAVASRLATPNAAEPVVAFAQTLLVVRRGIAEGEIDRTLNTIDFLVELAFLETADYAISLAHFRAILEGRASPNPPPR